MIPTVPKLTANEILERLKTVDGAGSGLDADTLDGTEASGFASAVHTHAAADITSGTFADARISESSVTQHESALSIAETQIPDGSILARVGGSETITGTWTFQSVSSLTFGSGSQDITLTDEGNDLLIQGGTATTNFLLEIASSDNDGTDDVALLIDSTGTSGVSDTESLFVGWDAGNTQYEIRSQITGAGMTLRPISLFTEGNAGQLDLDTAGNVTMSGRLGIGTTTIPHESIGTAKLHIEGADSSIPLGPNIQTTTSLDNHPITQLLSYSHDFVALSFDAYYYNGSWRSSDVGSNAQFWKFSDELSIRYGNGVAQGSILTWNVGLKLDLTNGNVEIPNGVVRIDDTSAATDASGATGALGVDGGISVAKDGYFGGDLSVDAIGDLNGGGITVNDDVNLASGVDLIFNSNARIIENANDGFTFKSNAAAFQQWKLRDSAGARLSIFNFNSGALTLFDNNTNEIVKFTGAVSSAVNYPEFVHSATGNAVEVKAAGSDTDIDIKLIPKGAGTVNITSLPTSSAGLNTGDLWNDSGTVKVA